MPKHVETTRQRRSERLTAPIPVLVSGKDAQGASFQEETTTMVVNAHGGLFLLSATVARGARLTIEHPVTLERQPVVVVFVGDGPEGKRQVGVEFARPAPNFWRVDYAPHDWKASAS
ncbi:MAG TPA: hypothetical protein VGA40_02840 [Candidatus Acidoferrales bacterium]